MQLSRNRIAAASILLIALLSPSAGLTRAQENQSRLVRSNGKGTLKVGGEQFKVTGVIVKLMKDGKAEVTVISEITIFLEGTWSKGADNPAGFDLIISGGATGGGLEGNGKLYVSDDGKSIKTLSIKGVSRTSKRNVELAFEGQSATS